MKPGSGEECLKTLSERPFDLVLLDVWLPKIDGLETLEKISELDTPPMVVMVSGHANIETAVRATKLGALTFSRSHSRSKRPFSSLKTRSIIFGSNPRIAGCARSLSSDFRFLAIASR